MLRKKVEKMLRKKTQMQVMEWLNSLDHHEYLEASRIINQIHRETPAYKKDPEYKKRIDASEKQLDDFEEKLAKDVSEKLMAEVNLDNASKGVVEGIRNIVTDLIEMINKNPPEIEEYKKFARDLRKYHIEQGIYDPDLWGDVDLD